VILWLFSKTELKMDGDHKDEVVFEGGGDGIFEETVLESGW
jgi:hypothetical protein